MTDYDYIGGLQYPTSIHPLTGSGQTIMEGFIQNTNFKNVRETSSGVSYNRITQMPEPQFWFQTWTYMYNR